MPLNSPIATAYDPGFIGFASRLNPVALPAGVLQLSENMRLDRGVAKVRKGARRLADDLVPSNFPLTLPFRFEPTLDVDIPFTLAINDSGLVLLNSYAGGVFASAAYRSPGLDAKEYIILATPSGGYIYSDEGLEERIQTLTDEAGDPITDESGNEIEVINYLQPLPYPEGETIDATDSVSMVQAFDRLYLLRSAAPNAQGYEWKRLSGSISVAGTTATVDLASHGYTAGMRVRIEGGSVAAFSGHEYDIVSAPTADTFTIAVPSGTAGDAALTLKARRVKAPLYWSGDITVGFVKTPAGIPASGPSFRTMRSVPWAAYINNRLVLPDGRDQVMLSDILDPDVYDPFWQSFRANQGSNDYIVGVHPWVEGSFLVFMRNSIWLAKVNQYAVTTGSDYQLEPAITSLELLTDEVGCSSRRTIQTAGQYVYFLSDNGVYRLDARLDLKLRGDTRPLSEQIADQIARIRPAQASNAVGLWYDNRYWLAAPIDGADLNNALFIYSALNERWETIDYYPFGLENLLVAQRQGANRRLYAASRAGKLFLLDDIDRGDDPPDSTLGEDYFSPVRGRMVTRRYAFDTMDAKRFTRVHSDVVLPNTGSIAVRARLINPDRTMTLVPGKTNDLGEQEDFTLKQPIRQKAHACEIEFETTAERPEIRTVSVEAALAGLPQTATRHEG